MAAGEQVKAWEGPSRRRAMRYPVQEAMDIIVLRSGVPDTWPGMSLNLSESGAAAVLAGELEPGETVGVELRLPQLPEPLRMKAVVRYQEQLRCGLEFVGLLPEQQAAIRDWTEQVQAKPQVANRADIAKKRPTPPAPEGRHREQSEGKGAPSGPPPPRRGVNRRMIGAMVLLAVAAVVLLAFWWHWNRGWAELEANLPARDTSADGPRVQVPPEVMEKLILHRVAPAYPESARQGKVQGVIALDIVVGKNGSVAAVNPLNGPDILARAAADAVRWWKYQPFQVNGSSVVAETTVAVEFKP